MCHNLQYEAVWRNISSLNRAAAFLLESIRTYSQVSFGYILCVDRREMTRFPKEGTVQTIKSSQEFGVTLVLQNELELQANFPLTEDFITRSLNAGY